MKQHYTSLLTGIAMSLGLSVAAVAPVHAASTASCQKEVVLGPDGVFIDRVEADADLIAMELRQQGYNVESVQPWGGCVKAFINDPSGGSHMEFFDPDSLEPLTP